MEHVGTAAASLAAEQNDRGVVPQQVYADKRRASATRSSAFALCRSEVWSRRVADPPFSAFTSYSEPYFSFLSPKLIYCS